MDETAAWLDLVENTTVNATGAKDMPQNLTGNEVFQVAKREASSSSNGSMKEKFTFELLVLFLQKGLFEVRLIESVKSY